MKTVEEEKQEAIKAAWGKWYEPLKNRISKQTGICNSRYVKNVIPSISQHFLHTIDTSTEIKEIGLVPHCLIDLNKNNGWARIEPDGSNFPERSASKLWRVYMLNGSIYDLNSNGLRHYFKRQECTHYKPIIEDKPPIF